MDKRDVIERLPVTLTALGRCMDILMDRPDDKNALHLCTVAANGLYLLCLKLAHCKDETLAPDVLEEIKKGADLLTKACEAYAEDCTSIEHVTEALRTLHTFQLCRQAISDFTKGSWKPEPVAEASAD